MNNSGQTIAKNALVMMVSQVLTWALTLLLTIYLPRYLGVQGVGIYHLATSLWVLIGSLAAFGMDIFQTKEVSRNPAKAEELFGTTIALRGILFVVGAGILAIYVKIAGYSSETVQVIALIGILNLVSQFTNSCGASLRGLEKMEYISLGIIVAKAIYTAASIIALLLGYGVVIIALINILAEGVNLLIQAYFLLRLRSINLRVNWSIAPWILKSSFPYLILYIYLIFYQQVDIVIISLLVDEKGVGWYSAADRLFGTFMFIPTIFTSAVFPAISRMSVTDVNALSKMIHKSFNLLMVVSVPIGFGVMVISGPLVTMLYGQEFLNSGLILAVMGLVLIFTFQNTILGQFLIATDRQKPWSWIMLIAVVASIPLDLILIPFCQKVLNNGAVGGALAFLITEPFMTVCAFMLLPKDIISWKNFQPAVRTLISGLLMVVAIWWIRDAFVVVPILIGGIVYVGSVLLLKVIPQEDWALLKEVGGRMFVHLRGRISSTATVAGKELK